MLRPHPLRARELRIAQRRLAQGYKMSLVRIMRVHDQLIITAEPNIWNDLCDAARMSSDPRPDVTANFVYWTAHHTFRWQRKEIRD